MTKHINNQSATSQVLAQGELSEEMLKVFEKAGWHLHQSNLDYTDLQLEITYQGKGDDDRCSFNINLTFDWEKGDFYLVLGTNLGDGFNDYHEIKNNGKHLHIMTSEFISKLRESTPNDKYIELIDKHQDAWQGVLDELKKMSEITIATTQTSH